MQRVQHSPLKWEDPLSQSNTESKPSSAETMEGFLVVGKVTFLRNLQNGSHLPKEDISLPLAERLHHYLPVAACVFQASSVPAHKYLYISKPPQTSSLLVLLSPQRLTFLLARHLPSERLLSVILFSPASLAVLCLCSSTPASLALATSVCFTGSLLQMLPGASERCLSDNGAVTSAVCVLLHAS